MSPLTWLFVLLAFTIQAQENFRSAAECGECHEAIHQDWLTSMHARATIEKNPLFRGMYELGVMETDGKLASKCITCHSPLSGVFRDIDPATPFNQDGVNCQFCHGASQITGYISASDIRIELDTVYSANPDPANAPHPVAHRDHFTNGEICLPCHAEMKNPKGLEVCATGQEWQTYRQESGKTCQDCHMPVIEGVPSHRFPGTHQNTTLANAVDMDLSFAPESGELKITLKNSGAGHAIPTGTPLRMVFLKLIATDIAGNLVWENWKANPIAEDRSSLFMKILGDDAGNGPVPPWKATQIVFERRLMPAQPVTISYHVPAREIYHIQATLSYRFAPPAILQRFGISDAHFTSDKILVQKAMVISPARE